MTVHEVASVAEWERAMADPDVSVIRFVAHVAGPLKYTGRNGSPGSPVVITASDDGIVYSPSAGDPAFEIPGTVRHLSFSGGPPGWIRGQRPKPPPPDWWTGGQAQPPRVPEVPTSDHYPTSEPAAEWRIEDNRMTDFRFYVDFNGRLLSPPDEYRFRLYSASVPLVVGQRIQVSDFDEIESTAEVSHRNADGSYDVVLIDFPPATEPEAPTVDREAWLLGQLVEARRQLEAGIDRLRALEERLTP